jgi:hypothetical protein
LGQVRLPEALLHHSLGVIDEVDGLEGEEVDVLEYLWAYQWVGHQVGEYIDYGCQYDRFLPIGIKYVK